MSDEMNTAARGERGAAAEPARARREWRTPRLSLEGTIDDLVQQGGGKLSVAGGDPGEGRKQSGGDTGG